jgi:hypothetical protein
MTPLERRLAVLEARAPALPELPCITIVSVSRDASGELVKRPHMFLVPCDPCQYLVADYEAWPDDVKARYDGAG